LSDDKRHDFGHAERVTRNAMWILDTLKIGESVDRNLLQAACYLHDVVVMKRDSRNYFSRFVSHFFEKNLNKKYLGKVLADFDLPWEEDQIIAEAIINHPNSIPFLVLNKEKDIYSKILQDADKLEATGAISIMRTFSSTGLMQRPFYHPEDPFCKNREPDSHNFAIDLFYTRLLKVEALMHTKMGRKIAKRRTIFLKVFLDELKKELEGK